jgi:o-succinylbenzoate---CoA ligase
MFALRYSSHFLDQEKIESLQASFLNEKYIKTSTSGSTGPSKEISLEISHMKASAQATNAFFGLRQDTSALLALSLDTIAGKMMLLRALVGNYSLIACPPKLRPLEDTDHDIDFVAMVPAQLRETLKHDVQKLKSIRVILIGGGPISSEVEDNLREEHLTVYHSFGMTETISHIAMRKCGYESNLFFEALPGVSFVSKDEKLVIHAPHLGVDSLQTNDLVELLSPTQFIWKGRADFVANSGGYKIVLEELESKISALIPYPFFLWKDADEKWGEKVVLCLENAGGEEIDLSSLQLKAWEKPQKTYYFQHFLRSESGKIRRESTFELNPIQVREKTL